MFFFQNRLHCKNKQEKNKRAHFLVEKNYAWAIKIDFSKPQNQHIFWYRSRKRRTQNLGQRHKEEGAEKEMKFFKQKHPIWITCLKTTMLPVAFKILGIQSLTLLLEKAKKKTISEFLNFLHAKKSSIFRIGLSSELSKATIWRNYYIRAMF